MMIRACQNMSPGESLQFSVISEASQKMQRNWLANTLLSVIALALVAIAIRPYIAPQAVKAESPSPYPFYFEPGTQMLRAP
jgi:hypothetical protein